jgi:class 3 adenylate cyclase/tetratricopeptide (TPR) repeat protein
MRCSKCGTDNAAGSRFCTQCATPLNKPCPECAHENISEAKFCAQCAAPLDVTELIRVEAEPRDGSLTGERRHLTVLFCDLVGSTEIAAQLDPEEWRETVAGYHRAAAQAITRFGGYVAKYLGDGVMAFFGYPEAHDNDAERAARAGLAILDAIAKLNEPGGAGFSLSSPVKLSARVGIDSGAVVVGAGAGKDADVFGDAPNIAARVQAVAEPGTVLITADTHRLVSGLFVVEERRARELKGVAKPVELYRVVRPTGVRGRLGRTRGLTRFVGREDELRLMLSRWERTREGEGQVVLVVGEAGIGKSRLLAKFHERIRDTPHIWMESAGDQFFANSPFHAITAMLSRWLELQGRAAEEQAERLERALSSAGLKPDEAAPPIADLLQLQLGHSHASLTLTPEQQRRRLLATLVEWVLGAARVQPLVLTIEDLHWADPSTLELIQLLVEQGARSRLLLLYTARPEFHAQWPLRAHHTQITLNRLSARHVREMIAQVAARNALSSETVDAVIERTSGVPLFVEELTRSVLESGTRLIGHEIPVTLHDSLMARLDRLGPAKEVAQIGAVIGREFSYELLHAVHPITEEDLQRALRSLADGELLYVLGIAPEANYQFKHALIRDAAYEALLKSRRKELHRLVARTIDEKFTALKEAQPEVLARHWTEAGETEPAITEWSRAGKAAQARHAFKEALESYQQALGLLNLLPESPDRDNRELELMQTVVQLLSITRGYGAPETIEAAERAAALAERSGNLTQLVDWLIRRGITAIMSGDLLAAGGALDQALELALRDGSPTSLGLGHSCRMIVRYWLGDLAGAEENFTAGLKFFDDPGFRQSPDHAVIAFGHASWVAWRLGLADLAREREVQMMAAARGNNPFAVAWSGFCAAYLRIYMREYEQAEALAARAVELSEKHQFPYVAALSRCALGPARAQLGRATEGIGLIRQGIAGLLEVEPGIGNYKAFLAEAQDREGSAADALETVEQALQANPVKLVYWPETLGLRGELRLKQGQTELAEADFREAIGLAQRMSAKFHELRGTMSLARLLARQGRRHEAHAMLAEIYGWFTDGFDTADLKDAKALLDELGE